MEEYKPEVNLIKWETIRQLILAVVLVLFAVSLYKDIAIRKPLNKLGDILSDAEYAERVGDESKKYAFENENRRLFISHTDIELYDLEGEYNFYDKNGKLLDKFEIYNSSEGLVIKKDIFMHKSLFAKIEFKEMQN